MRGGNDMKAYGDQIAQLLVEDHTIAEEEKRIYSYIFDYVIENVIYTCILLLIGLLCGRLGVTICYLLVAMPLRWFAGGYHANSRKECNVLSYGVFAIVLFVVPHIAPLLHLEWTMLYGIGWIGILAVAPVDTPNKRLSPGQRALLHRRCIMLCIGLSLVEGWLWWQQKNLYYAAISICVIIELIGLLMGIAKNRREL